MYRIRILIILWAVLSLSLPVSAREIWHAVTDAGCVALKDVECLISTDGNPCFNMLLKSGKLIPNISKLTFESKEPGAVGALSSIFNDDSVTIMHNTITITNAEPGSMTMILTVDGRTLMSKTIDGAYLSFDISDLPKAPYILSVNGNSLKFMKQ